MKGPLSGTRAWLVQRASALYLLGFTVFVLARMSGGVSQSYEAWRAWTAGGGARVAVLLFFVSLLLHTWVGLRDVAIDYVRPFALRVAVLTAVALGETALGIWAALIIVQSR